MQSKKAVCLGAVFAVSMAICANGTRAADDPWHLTGPYSFENLTVFLVHGEGAADGEIMLPLDEAIEKGYLTVHETGNVGELEVENRSDWPVYIQSGCIVKGGRQDRMIPNDIVVAARSGKKPLASYCVERGRWSARAGEDDQVFEVSPAIIADRKILMAAKVEESQSKVWEEVAAKVDKFSPHVRGGRAASPVSPSSLQLALENEDIQTRTSAYVDAITSQTRSRTDAVGLVVVVNGEICSADIYHGSTLFEKLYGRLIDAAAVEALARSADGVLECNLTAEDVSGWLAKADDGEVKSKSVADAMYLRSKENSKTITFESLSDADESRWIHKSILSKLGNR